MKKKLLLSIAALLCFLIAWAQPAQLQVAIQLTTNSSAIQGTALPGYEIFIWDRDATSGVGRSYYTDATGNLNMLLTSTYTTSTGSFSYEVRDCQNQIVSTQTVNYNTLGAQVTLANSILVSCVDPCNVFANYSNNGNTYYFSAHSGMVQRWDMNNAEWDFSDGTTHTGQYLNKTFPLGSHTWRLSHQGCAVDSGFINVIGNCNAAFSVDTPSSNNGVVNMFNNSTPTSLNNTLYFLWNFGDGTTSTQPFPQHQYSGNGPYSIFLRIFEVDLQGDTICQSWHGDTLGIDSAGNVFKTGLSLNVLDPNSIGLIDNEDVVFTIYPQPASEVIRIETKAKLNQAELVDLNGRVVQEWFLDNNTSPELILKSHPAGLYILRTQSARGFSSHKCLIE